MFENLNRDQILKLILKDFKTFRNHLLLGFLPSLAISAFMVTKVDNESWVPFIGIGCAAVSFVIGICFLSEKFRKIEVFICSLPVTRTSILLSKYITAALIAIAGFGTWFLAASLLNTAVSTAPDNFYLFLNPYIWLTIIFYFTILISFLMPVLAGLDRIIVIAVIILACALLFIEGFHYILPFIKANPSVFEPQSFLLVLVLSLIIILSPYFSLNVSARIFNKRDL